MNRKRKKKKLLFVLYNLFTRMGFISSSPFQCFGMFINFSLFSLETKYEKALKGFVEFFAPSNEARHSSPFSGMMLCYMFIWLVSGFNNVVLLLALANAVALYLRIRSIGESKWNLLPTFGDCYSYTILAIKVMPVKIVATSVGLVVAALFERLFESYTSRLDAPLHTAWLSRSVVLQVVAAKLTALLFNMTTKGSRFKAQHTYGSFWTALMLPVFNGMGYCLFLLAQQHFFFVILQRFCPDSVSRVFLGMPFYVVQRLAFSNLFLMHFLRYHQL